MGSFNKMFSKDNAEQYKEFSTCMFCGERFDKGGFWHGIDVCIGVCQNDVHFLFDLAIDTINDDDAIGKLSSKDKVEHLTNILKERMKKKDMIEKESSTKESMKKFELNYYAELGIIDFFDLGMTRNELSNKIFAEASGTLGQYKVDGRDLDNCEEFISDLIKKKEGEKPVIISYFTYPNFEFSNFNIGAVAKIYNNGSTFVFVKSEEIIKALDFVGFNPRIHKLF